MVQNAVLLSDVRKVERDMAYSLKWEDKQFPDNNIKKPCFSV